MNVLIVDECKELRIALAVLLSSFGFKVFTSENNKEALNILKESESVFDLLLTENCSSNLQGIEFLEEVILLKTKIQKIIILSNIAECELRLERMIANNSHIKFLHKITTTENLLHLIVN
jgi:DNA-binding NtrC family response regulator